MNTNQLKISIIIPVYNVEPYIADCIKSVMRQTYTGPLECIIVDDCGTDNSIEIAERLIAEYKGHIQFRILHHEHNRGLSAARNTGSDAATGEYIYYLDSDDYISDDCIEVLTQPLQDYEYDMVMGGAVSFNTPHPQHFLKKETGPILTKESIVANQYYPFTSLYHMAWNKLVKKSLYNTSDMTFLEGQLYEDILWTYKCCACMQSLYVQNSTTYYYRVREGSIMRTWQTKRQLIMQSTHDMIEYVLQHPILELDKDQYNNVVVGLIGSFFTACVVTNNRELFVDVRRKINYNPMKLWMRGRLSLRHLKHQLVFAFPPIIGFYYHKFRLWKIGYLKDNTI